MNEYSFTYICSVKAKDPQKEQTIFQAALDVIAERGLAGLSMEAIAREAKIATGTLYIYFRSKEELVGALYKATKIDMAQKLMAGVDFEGPFRPALHHTWNNLLDSALADYKVHIFHSQFYVSPFSTPEAKARSLDFFAPIIGLVERGKAEHRIKNLDTLLLVSFVYGSVQEIASLSRYTGTPLDAATREAAFQLCWDGMKL